MSYLSAVFDRKVEKVIVWERNKDGRTRVEYDPPYYFYIPHEDGEHTSLFGDKLLRCDFESNSEFYNARKFYKQDYELFESDIRPELKVLSKNYFEAPAPTLHTTFFDIEVDYDKDRGFSSPRTAESAYAPINAVAFYHDWLDKYVILVVPPLVHEDKVLAERHESEWTTDALLKEINLREPLPVDMTFDLQICKDETELLEKLLVEIKDSDVLSGWNSDFFDIPYVGRRLKKKLGESGLRSLNFDMRNFEMHAKTPEDMHVDKPYRGVMTKYGSEAVTLDLSGRVKLDYMELFRKFEMEERPSYKLEAIADEVVPELPKLEYEGSLHGLFRDNFPMFVRYNIRDTEVLHGFERKLGYVALANEMVHLSTGLFQHIQGTIALAQQSTINYCHYKLDVVAPDSKPPPEVAFDMEGNLTSGKIQGACVLLPQVGLHEYIGSVDIKSLYPSVIRSLNISPETIRGQFDQTTRAPELIATNSDEELTLVLEGGQEYTLPASSWRKKLKDSRWAVSGYGTVFDQTVKGVMPMILQDWYETRQGYQQKKKDAFDGGDTQKVSYYDRLQYCYKIKLNSYYGALANKYFKFFDLRMAESTTGTGRMILLHQCAETVKVLDGEYMMPNRSEERIDSKTKLPKIHIGYQNDTSLIYGDSVAGDTVIETQRGSTKIEDLFTEIDYVKGTKEYSRCSVCALTYVADIKTNEFRPIKYVVRHKVNKKMYRVWYGNTRYLDVTQDHSLIGYTNSAQETPGFVEVKPTDIGTNSLIINGYLPQASKDSKHQLSKEMWQLIGFVVGDGHVECKQEGGVGLSLGSDDKDEIIEKMIVPLIQQGWFTSIVHVGSGHDIRLCGVKGWKFLRNLLYKNNVKQIPNLTEEYIEDIEHFLTGCFSAGGFVDKNHIIGVSSANMDFITGVNRLLKLCGIPSNYWTETTENSFDGVYSGTYTKRLTVYDSVKFGDRIGFIQDQKNRNIPVIHGKPTKHRELQNGFSLITPTLIEEIQSPEFVYDIEVGDTHMFYANDLLVHNTDSSYFKTHTENERDAVLVADRVGGLVNSSFPEYMRNTFLCAPDFSNIISTSREVVSDRGIFVDKKRYVLHIVDDEGKKTDKLKVMGLDTKKTTLPKVISTQLNKFIERFLKGEDWNVIAEDIVAYKDELLQNEVLAIGLPKGVKKVEYYLQQLQLYGSAVRLPGHVAASIFYNQCLEENHDKVSPPITSGMKIKVYYLKGQHCRSYGVNKSVHVRKFKSIALPTDIEVVPDWFTNHFVPQLDYDAQILRLVDKPLDNILKAIQKEPPTKQSLFVDSFIEF